jgi:hypothetical protein
VVTLDFCVPCVLQKCLNLQALMRCAQQCVCSTLVVWSVNVWHMFMASNLCMDRDAHAAHEVLHGQLRARRGDRHCTAGARRWQGWSIGRPMRRATGACAPMGLQHFGLVRFVPLNACSYWCWCLFLEDLSRGVSTATTDAHSVGTWSFHHALDATAARWNRSIPLARALGVPPMDISAASWAGCTLSLGHVIRVSDARVYSADHSARGSAHLTLLRAICP